MYFSHVPSRVCGTCLYCQHFVISPTDYYKGHLNELRGHTTCFRQIIRGFRKRSSKQTITSTLVFHGVEWKGLDVSEVVMGSVVSIWDHSVFQLGKERGNISRP